VACTSSALLSVSLDGTTCDYIILSNHLTTLVPCYSNLSCPQPNFPVAVDTLLVLLMPLLFLVMTGLFWPSFDFALPHKQLQLPAPVLL